MYSLIFAICLTNGQCVSQTPDMLFTSEEACIEMAGNLITLNMKRVEEGKAPPHAVRFACYNWGEQA